MRNFLSYHESSLPSKLRRNQFTIVRKYIFMYKTNQADYILANLIMSHQHVTCFFLKVSDTEQRSLWPNRPSFVCGARLKEEKYGTTTCSSSYGTKLLLREMGRRYWRFNRSTATHTAFLWFSWFFYRQ